MSHLIRKCWAIFLFGITIPTFAAFPTVSSLVGLKNALDSGEWVRAVIHFRTCMLVSSSPSNAVGNQFTNNLDTLGFNLSTYTRHFSTSNENGIDEIEVNKHFLSISSIADIGTVENDIQIKFSAPNQVDIVYNLINPMDNSIQYTFNFNCNFGATISNTDPTATRGVSLYRIMSAGGSSSR